MMKGKCSVKMNSTMTKYGVSMFIERDVAGATIYPMIAKDEDIMNVIIEKDSSGYSDRTSAVIRLRRETAFALASSILEQLGCIDENKEKDEHVVRKY